MDSRAVVPYQQPREEVKQKNLVAEDGRKRRVLQDIGNLVIDHAVHGKKPIASSVDNEVIGNVARGRRVPVPPKAAAAAIRNVFQKCEAIEIRSNGSEECQSVSRRTSRARTTRKEMKTLKPILTAVCGLSNKLKEEDLLLNIDAEDADNDLAVVEYVDDIYKFYKLTEVDGRLHDYMQLQPEINAKMRAILVVWLIEVHRKFELMPETIYLSINILDRYLSVKVVPRRELQLVGISAMLIACKYEEIRAPEVNDFVHISESAYIKEQVLAMEETILEKLDWYLTVPTPYVFLVRYVKASVPFDRELENMTFFLAELGLIQYPIVILYCPSLIAASAVYAARNTLDKRPFWTETLKHQTGYSEDALIECAKLLVKCHSTAADGKLRTVHKKFLSVDRGSVALHSPAKSPVAKSS
ncbi:hypothetical protein K2173_016737 [Erythroxylum novogranatense]|uniref:B-like cyclin n=1 Tax=Erythroxylum novogranatense TaxID=1862640 RepID=A0AAV8SHB8_9ROSI|nr:hypothetical protein K2173_016737 [Erythroxylum novogranatense]